MTKRVRGVYVPAPVATALWPAVRGWLHNNRGHRTIAAVAEEWEQARREWLAAQVGSVPGSVSVPFLDASGSEVAPSELVASLTVSEVAHRAGLTARAVRKAAVVGRLPGVRTSGQWRFSEAAANEFAAGRGGAA